MGDSNGPVGTVKQTDDLALERSQLPQRAIRIGNASGAIGDGLDQVYKLARDGNVDAITGDYLAEFNIAWKAIEMRTRPDLGYEPNFLQQLAFNDGAGAKLLAEKRIKVVNNGGALNPRGLATEVFDYLQSLGLGHLKVAWVSGDDLTSQLRTGELGSLKHLDIQGKMFEGPPEKILAANAYTGMRGIVAALENGADIVICGRCCDASPVMGLAYWWHGWNAEDYDAIAGSLMAGHLIECGPYVTGGNYCGFQEIEQLYRVGYPIAEIEADGTSIITKSENTNGAVTVDTTKAQLLYEIQGPIYLNPDVVARIDKTKLEEIAENKIKLSGVQGLPPPPETKLAICMDGGYQAEIFAYCAGLDTSAKFAWLKENVLRQMDPKDFDVISIEPYGSPIANPRSQKECTVSIRLFAQAQTTAAIDKFRKAIFFNGMIAYAGFHLGMDWRTMDPRPFVKYAPALVSQDQIKLSVSFIRLTAEKSLHAPSSPITLQNPSYTSPAPSQVSLQIASPTPHLSSFGPATPLPLGSLVFARSGDKGGNANIGLWVRSADAYPWLLSFLTVPRIIDLLADDWRPEYRVERTEFPELWALNFVVYGFLQEGVSSSSIIDGFGKSVGEFVRARVVDLPTRLVEEETRRRERLMGWKDAN